VKLPLALVLALVAPTILAGCATPENNGPCVPLVLEPAESTLRAGEQFMLVDVSITNCGAEALTLDGGPCGYDLLPRLTRGTGTWVLLNGAALRPESLVCDQPAVTATVQPGETTHVNARWNGLLETDTGAFLPAPAGDYETSASALGERATGTVRVQ
jgi:hypothetical protein